MHMSEIYTIHLLKQFENFWHLLVIIIRVLFDVWRHWISAPFRCFVDALFVLDIVISLISIISIIFIFYIIYIDKFSLIYLSYERTEYKYVCLHVFFFFFFKICSVVSYNKTIFASDTQLDQISFFHLCLQFCINHQSVARVKYANSP